MKNKGLVSFFWLILFSISFPALADISLWEDSEDIKAISQKTADMDKQSYQKARVLKLDRINMVYALEAMARENLSYRFATVESSQNISLPLPDGSMIEVELIYENLLEASLKKAYPLIKTYRVLASAKVVSGVLDMTPQGFHGMLQTSAGRIVFIDPINNKENTYVSYYKDDQNQHKHEKFSCGASRSASFEDISLAERLSASKFIAEKSSSVPQGLLNYRIAIAATGEYTAKHGGTVEGALAGMVTTLSRINQVFEKDLGVHLSLVSNNAAIIYTDADLDPYNATNSRELMQQNQANLDAVIGSTNYDIGHLFTTRGGGLAEIAGVCNHARKGQGITGISNPFNDTFDLDFVAHELGHQLGATHTFNGNQALCAGATRTSETAFEPGSGSSLMSYAGYCGVDNLQSKTDAMFHMGSIQQIRSFAQTSGANCGVLKHSLNRPPVVNAGRNYVIPTRTPFTLTGSATDPDSDNLVYSWEQMDAGERSPINEDKGDNALFRIYMRTSSPSRHFPRLESLIKHKEERGEKLAEKNRDLHFSFVAQDNHNVAQADEMRVKVFPTKSRFSLYLPHSQYSRGDTHKLLWNVGGTNKSPINCASIDVALSTDGGYHFPVKLMNNIPNTGVAWVTIPATTSLSTLGRFKISCSDNIFFAISYRDFGIAEQGTIAIVLNDQDQLEPDTGKPNTTGGGNQSVKTAGASFDGMILWVLFLMIALKGLGGCPRTKRRAI